MKAGGRRGSLLRRVVWGDDLRRERETRLAAANSRKMSPYPRGKCVLGLNGLGFFSPKKVKTVLRFQLTESPLSLCSSIVYFYPEFKGSFLQ